MQNSRVLLVYGIILLDLNSNTFHLLIRKISPKLCFRKGTSRVKLGQYLSRIDASKHSCFWNIFQ